MEQTEFNSTFKTNTKLLSFQVDGIEKFSVSVDADGNISMLPMSQLEIKHAKLAAEEMAASIDQKIFDELMDKILAEEAIKRRQHNRWEIIEI